MQRHARPRRVRSFLGELVRLTLRTGRSLVTAVAERFDGRPSTSAQRDRAAGVQQIAVDVENRYSTAQDQRAVRIDGHASCRRPTSHGINPVLLVVGQLGWTIV